MIKKMSEINADIEKNAIAFVEKSENVYADKIQTVADNIIANRAKKPIVLLSGPSGSGKTTTALSIEKFLDFHGFESHTLSLDNYFKDVTDKEKPLLEHGLLDLENPNRVDVEFLNDQLVKLARCEEVELPVYDFVRNKREFSGKYLKRKENELILLEGVHALNPDIITISKEHCVTIFVSVGTDLEFDGGVLTSKDIRLMRRMLRDSIYRGRDAYGTLKMFESVEIGAEKFVYPYRYRADYDVDSFIDYEINAYKPFIEKELRKIPSNETVNTMLSALEKTVSVADKHIPRNSLVREFIGDSDFVY